jgi:hypothetical protein
MQSKQPVNKTTIKLIITHVFFALIFFNVTEEANLLSFIVSGGFLIKGFVELKNLRIPQEIVVERRMKKWEKKRQKGMKIHLLFDSFLIGIPVAFIFWISTGEYDLYDLFIKLAAFSFAGFVIVFIGWKFEEREYLKWIEKKK